jgi:predicted 3-demethylubiquinone-9 3-methyltransferase (glyoxalase superfamily)
MEQAQKIIPFLWFDTEAEKAMNHYVGIFKNAKILSVTRYGDGGRGPAGAVMTCSFEIEGMRFIALNGGPAFSFTEAISLLVSCESQPEIDELWEKLSAGGEKGRCGWLKDCFGISWQIVPRLLGEMLQDPDREKSGRVMQAMLQMDRIDLARLREAYAG